MRFIMALFYAALIATVSTSADARPKHKRQVAQAALIVCDQQGCRSEQGRNARPREKVARTVEYDARIVGGRPAGCPHRYCGCALSLKVFGRIIPELNLAANWVRKFPRARPAAGMVAARSGHTFLIQDMIDANTALAWDPNSGRGKTRIHERSLRGYVIVNPNGSRMAMK